MTYNFKESMTNNKAILEIKDCCRKHIQLLNSNPKFNKIESANIVIRINRKTKEVVISVDVLPDGRLNIFVKGILMPVRYCIEYSCNYNEYFNKVRHNFKKYDISEMDIDKAESLLRAIYSNKELTEMRQILRLKYKNIIKN